MRKILLAIIIVIILTFVLSIIVIIFQVTHFCGFHLDPFVIKEIAMSALISFFGIIIITHGFCRHHIRKTMYLLDKLIKKTDNMTQEEFDEIDAKINSNEVGDDDDA